MSRHAAAIVRELFAAFGAIFLNNIRTYGKCRKV
jgi:hypothetical protein